MTQALDIRRCSNLPCIMRVRSGNVCARCRFLRARESRGRLSFQDRLFELLMPVLLDVLAARIDEELKKEPST